MKPIQILGMLFLFSLIHLAPIVLSQGINPNHLYKTGINMGHLTMNKENNSGTENYGTWASNTAGEWLASWIKGSVSPIPVSIDNPSATHEDIIKAIQSMPSCVNPYYQAKLSIYRAGFHLGRAMVATNTICSRCLQSEMQKAAIELRTISSLLDKSVYADFSQSLNVNASNLNLGYNNEMSLQQNQGMFELINSIHTSVDKDLPDKLFVCQSEKEPEAQAVKDQPQKDNRKNRAFILKGGINKAILKGDQGTTTASKTGFSIGFDMYRGNPVFFVIGAKYFKNATGEELMVPLPGQIITDDSYHIQGWVLGAGVGGYLHQKNDFKVSGLIKVNYIVSHSINGNLLSIGLTEVTDGAFSLEIGAGFSYEFAFVEFTFEPGLSEVLISDGEKFKYSMVNFNLGLRF